ncbi:MAG: hypothetical protein WCG32_01535 [Actinomycetes bacterium]
MPIVQDNSDAASAATNSTQVSMGENYSFSIAQALGSSNYSNNNSNCGATSYSMTITSATDEEIYSRSDSFLTEKCISRPSDWEGILIWDKTQCEVNFDSCSLFADSYLAAPGDYTITFNLAIGFDEADNLSNSFIVEVLPTYLYKIVSDDSRIYPNKDGFKDSLTGNVSFWNETGETISVSGVEVGLKSGSKLIESGSVKPSGEFELTPQEDLLGAFTLVASKLPKASGGRKWVGLGEPSEIKLYPTQVTEATLRVPAEIYPEKDNYLDVGYIGFNALSNSESQVKVTGNILIKRGNVTIKTFAVTKSGYSQFKWDGRDNGEIISGYYSVQAKVTGPQGRSKIARGTIKVVPTQVTEATLTVPAEIYPQKDNYLDVGYIGLNALSNSESQVKVSGTVVIKRGNVTVKTFEVTKSGYSQFTWDGRDNGEIISGYYSVQAKVTGPQGGSKITKKTIKVVNKKWVTTTLSKTYDAYVAADVSVGDSYDPINRDTSGAWFYSSGDGDTMLVKLSVPINSSTVKWRIKFNNWSTTGATFTYFPCQNSDCLSSYDSSLMKVFPSWDEGAGTWTKWAYNSGTSANFLIGSTDYGSITVDSFTVEYVVRTLK